MDLGVCAVLSAFVLFTGLLVVVFGSRSAKTDPVASREPSVYARFSASTRSFRARCAELGLREVRQLHCVGTVDGRDVVVGYYGGSRNLVTLGAGSGVLVIVRTTVPGQGYGADLSALPPRVWGRGAGEHTVRALLTPDVLQAVEELEEARLFPAGGLLDGSLLDLVIRGGWPGGWDELAIRAVIPTASAMSAAIRQLSTAAERVEAAAAAPDASPARS